MFNKKPDTLMDLYKYSFVDRIFIKLNTRALGANLERLFVVLPVIIKMNDNDKKLLDNTKRYLLNTLSPHNLALKVYDRVILQLIDYEDDNNLYIQDRQRAFEILRQNIQLLGVIDSIFDDEFNESKETIMDIVRKQYDEAYTLDEHTKNLLAFQEKHY